jgi:transposase
VITDAQGIPLAASVTGGNRNDVTQLMPLVDAIPQVTGRRGRPRSRPDVLYADRGYDHDKYRRLLRAKGIATRIARRGQPHGSGLGIYRYVVERTSPGTTASGDSAPAGNAAPTSTKPSSTWRPASSPTDTSNDFVRTS